MATQARLTPELIRAIFAEALTLEFGIRLPIEAVYQDYAKTIIYQAMKNDPERDKIMVCAFPMDGEIWFVKQTVEVVI
jgi:hypothetical protein